jgi:hypothetical protein
VRRPPRVLAEWLSQPDSDWGRDEAAKDGDHFAASVLRFEADITARRGPDGWVLSREPGDCSLLAVRFGPGLGWSPEAIVYGEDMGAALREFLLEEADAGDVEHIAIGFDEPPVMLTYRADPPRLSIEGVIQ